MSPGFTFHLLRRLCVGIIINGEKSSLRSYDHWEKFHTAEPCVFVIFYLALESILQFSQNSRTRRECDTRPLDCLWSDLGVLCSFIYHACSLLYVVEHCTCHAKRTSICSSENFQKSNFCWIVCCDQTPNFIWIVTFLVFSFHCSKTLLGQQLCLCFCSFLRNLFLFWGEVGSTVKSDVPFFRCCPFLVTMILCILLSFDVVPRWMLLVPRECIQTITSCCDLHFVVPVNVHKNCQQYSGFFGGEICCASASILSVFNELNV